VTSNILFIYSDQHRHNVLGAAGHPMVETPVLDGLAGRGVRFTEVWCQSPICQPSRASVITGQYTHELGLYGNTGSFDPSWPTVMRSLQGAGYETASIGKTHYHGPPSREEVGQSDGLFDMRSFEPWMREFGWDHVLEEYDKYMHVFKRLSTPYTEHLAEHGLLDAYRDQIRDVFRRTPTHWQGQTSVLPQEHDLTSFIADQAIDWLDQRDADRPFFLKLGFVQPHVPLIDDPDWAAFYADADIDVPNQTPPRAVNDAWAAHLASLDDHSQIETMSEEWVRNGIRHYLGMVSLVDQRIGDVVASLDRLGQLDDTWIVYSGDHGEMLGEHRLWAKMNFYRGSVQIPLIIVPPGGMAGRVDGALVEGVDVTATLAAIGGASGPEGGHGQSLLPATEGQLVGREVLFSRIRNYSAARTDRYRFTLDTDSDTPCELFDLENDPDELENLVMQPSQGSRVGEFHERILTHQAS